MIVDLHLGDCLEILPTLADNSVDAVITDPPYKVSQKYGGGIDADNLLAVSSIIRLFPELSRVLKPDRFMAVFYDNRILPFIFEAIKGTDFVYRKQIFLYRRWGIAHRWIGWMQCTDPVCIFVNGYNKPFAPEIKWQVKHDCYTKAHPEDDDTGHPAQKPIEIVTDMAAWFTNEGETVLDPFMGSGTTGVACSQIDRRFIGIDNNSDYYEIAEKRIKEAQLQMRMPI